MNLDYVKAAEADIRNLPFLKQSVSTLEKKRGFCLQKDKAAKPPDFKDPYLSEKKINESLNEALALAEISAALVSVKAEIKMIEDTLQKLPKEEREVLTLFYQQGLNALQIGERLFFESEKTIYKLRNQGLYHYCLIYYGKSNVKK